MSDPLTPAQTISFLVSVIDSGEQLNADDRAAIRATLDAERAAQGGLREAALRLYDEAAEFYPSEWIDYESSMAMKVTISGRTLARLRAALAAQPTPTLDAEPPAPWRTINQVATDEGLGLYSVVEKALIGGFSPSRKRLLAQNVVIAVANWRETFRDCGCRKSDAGFSLCDWHERLYEANFAARLSNVTAPEPSPDTEEEPR